MKFSAVAVFVLFVIAGCVGERTSQNVIVSFDGNRTTSPVYLKVGETASVPITISTYGETSTNKATVETDVPAGLEISQEYKKIQVVWENLRWNRIGESLEFKAVSAGTYELRIRAYLNDKYFNSEIRDDDESDNSVKLTVIVSE